MQQFVDSLCPELHTLKLFGPDLDPPHMSRLKADTHNPVYGKMTLDKMHLGATIIQEFYKDATKINFIKLFHLNHYPLPKSIVEPYENVKKCEVCYFLNDTSKLFHFIGELPSLKKLVITHSAVCDVDDGAMGQVETAVMFPRIQTCPTLKYVNLEINSRFHQATVEQKERFGGRVYKIAEYLLSHAPNLNEAKFVISDEIKERLRPLYGHFNVILGSNLVSQLQAPNGSHEPQPQRPVLFIEATNERRTRARSRSTPEVTPNEGGIEEEDDDDDVIFTPRH